MSFPFLHILNSLQSSLTVYILLCSSACCVTSAIASRHHSPRPHTVCTHWACILSRCCAQRDSCGGFIKGILRGVRCTKSIRVLFLHWRPSSWTTLVLYSRAVFIFNEPAFGVFSKHVKRLKTKHSSAVNNENFLYPFFLYKMGWIKPKKPSQATVP